MLVGRLRLGIALSAQYLVPFAGYLGAFLRDHPGVDVRMRPAAALVMLDMVENGEPDCAIGPALEQRGRLRRTSLASEPLALTCRSDHELVRRDHVTVADLAGERFDVPPGLDRALRPRDLQERWKLSHPGPLSLVSAFASRRFSSSGSTIRLREVWK